MSLIQRVAMIDAVRHADRPEGSFSDWSRIFDQLQRIRELPDDWDGEGTNAPPPDLVDYALVLAQSFQQRGREPANRVHVGVNQTIFFEWHTPLGYEEVEVTGAGVTESRSVPKGAELPVGLK